MGETSYEVQGQKQHDGRHNIIFFNLSAQNWSQDNFPVILIPVIMQSAPVIAGLFKWLAVCTPIERIRILVDIACLAQQTHSSC